LRAISNLIEAAKRVDWKNVPAFTPTPAKREPPSWTARRARRMRPKPPPDFIKSFIEGWRHVDNRALLFSMLLTARRLLSPAPVRQMPDIMLAIAQQWLEGLPQLCPPEVEAHEDEHAC
jgi:hypothetical protein